MGGLFGVVLPLYRVHWGREVLEGQRNGAASRQADRGRQAGRQAGGDHQQEPQPSRHDCLYLNGRYRRLHVWQSTPKSQPKSANTTPAGTWCQVPRLVPI